MYVGLTKVGGEILLKIFQRKSVKSLLECPARVSHVFWLNVMLSWNEILDGKGGSLLQHSIIQASEFDYLFHHSY